jgi:hypothetical protein
MVMAGRSLVNNQGHVTKNLVDIVTSLAKSAEKTSENVEQLEVLYREQITELSKSVYRQETKQGSIEGRLINIEKILQEAIEICRKRKEQNGKSN